MFDAPIHVANERLKGLTGILYNLATGLIAAVAARVYSDGAVTLIPVWWTAGALILIWMPTEFLSLQQQED